LSVYETPMSSRIRFSHPLLRKSRKCRSYAGFRLFAFCRNSKVTILVTTTKKDYIRGREKRLAAGLGMMILGLYKAIQV